LFLCLPADEVLSGFTCHSSVPPDGDRDCEGEDVERSRRESTSDRGQGLSDSDPHL